jgi:hypothetical protein
MYFFFIFWFFTSNGNCLALKRDVRHCALDDVKHPLSLERRSRTVTRVVVVSFPTVNQQWRKCVLQIVSETNKSESSQPGVYTIAIIYNM